MTDPQIEVMQHLAKAPALVFLIVAASDGKVDQKEIKQFGKILKDNAYEPLFVAMQQTNMSMVDLILSVKNSNNSPIEDLALIRRILDQMMPENVAKTYKVMLLMLAKSIAEASGGFLGIFGSKISQEEKLALAAIASTLGVLEEGSQTEAKPAADTQYQSVADLPDNLFPALKTAEWGKDAKGSVVMNTIFEASDPIQYEPVIGYAIDSPEAITFLNCDMIAESMTVQDVHARALMNLEARLLGNATWEPLKYAVDSSSMEPISGLVLTGDYYCSEAMLSETLLQQAHDKLGSELIMVMAPERGKLFATQIVSQQDPEPERILFASFAIAQFFNPEQAPISPNVWISLNGSIVGHVKGMDDIIASAKKHAEADMQREEEQLPHKAGTFSDGSGVGIRIKVQAHNIEIMFKNLQHIIRGYVQHGIKDDKFTGAIDVVLEIKDSQFNPAMIDALKTELDDMFDFLTNQCSSLGFRGKDNSAIRLNYEVSA
jgi:tellurite resistance protein